MNAHERDLINQAREYLLFGHGTTRVTNALSILKTLTDVPEEPEGATAERVERALRRLSNSGQDYGENCRIMARGILEACEDDLRAVLDDLRVVASDPEAVRSYIAAGGQWPPADPLREKESAIRCIAGC